MNEQMKQWLREVLEQYINEAEEHEDDKTLKPGIDEPGAKHDRLCDLVEYLNQVDFDTLP